MNLHENQGPRAFYPYPESIYGPHKKPPKTPLVVILIVFGLVFFGLLSLCL
jgi:hypothetical protein